jgi:hypothetical protein
VSQSSFPQSGIHPLAQGCNSERGLSSMSTLDVDRPY